MKTIFYSVILLLLLSAIFAVATYAIQLAVILIIIISVILSIIYGIITDRRYEWLEQKQED